MIIKTEIEVKDCRSCPFAYRHNGHGECWTECSNKKHGRDFYENILWGCQENFEKVPDWCPLGLVASIDSLNSVNPPLNTPT